MPKILDIDVRTIERYLSKYATDKIYQANFRESAKEYKQILKLNSQDKVRDTMYVKVLTAVASFENGLATLLKQKTA